MQSYDYINHPQTVAAACGVSQVTLQSHETGNEWEQRGGEPLGKIDYALCNFMQANVSGLHASFDP